MTRAETTDQPAEPRIVLGMGLRLVSALSLALMFAGVKWAGQRGAGIVETLFYRQIGSVVCAGVFVALGPGFASLRTKRVKAHAIRMGIGVVAMLLNFLMVTLLPLAEATAIGFSVPIFATLFAAVMLREPTGKWRWGAVIVGFLGVLVIVQPGNGHISVYGGLIALVFARQRFQQLNGVRHVPLDGALGGLEVNPTNLGQGGCRVPRRAPRRLAGGRALFD